MKFKAVIGLVLLAAASSSLHADLALMKTVKINPKTAPAFSNLLGEPEVEMREAMVEIRLGTPNDRIKIEAEALFVMVNSGEDAVAMTVGFPISDSMYSACEFDTFEVRSNGEARTVFHRITGYPRYRRDIWQSGPENDPTILPDSTQDPNLIGDLGKWAPRKPVTTSIRFPFVVREPEASGRITRCNNLMVWREDFAPGEVRKILVKYSFYAPAQAKSSLIKRVHSAQKGIWQEEANNCPDNLLAKLRSGDYFFFDYFLVTGASWKGPIGKEVISLHLPDGFSASDLTSNMGESLKYVDNILQYTLENAEPVQNLYFALRATPESTKGRKEE